MFVALGQLALSTAGTSWSSYLRVQAPALVTAMVVCAVSLPTRVVLERTGSSSGVITTAIFLVASIPWTAGVLWQMGEPGLERIRTRLPASVTAIVDAFGRRITTYWG